MEHAHLSTERPDNHETYMPFRAEYAFNRQCWVVRQYPLDGRSAFQWCETQSSAHAKLIASALNSEWEKP